MGEVSRTFSLETENKEKHRLYCDSCNQETLHSIVASYDEQGIEEIEAGIHDVFWNEKNQTIQCLGCERVSFRKVFTFSEDYDIDREGEMFLNETINVYPKLSKGVKSLEINLLPENIRKIYKETVLALDNEQFILAGIGIRAIVETVCKEKSASGSNLYQQIDSLKTMSLVTTDGADILHKLRIMGNDAAHEVKAHNSLQLELAIRVIENMLDGTYVIPHKVNNAFSS